MLNYILYRIGRFLSLCLPINLSCFIAKIISWVQYLFLKQDRVCVRNNLKVIFPGIEDRLLEKYTRGVFINFGQYLTEFFRFKKIDLDFVKENISIESLKNINNALLDQKGVIIVSAHIGNWELGAAALGILGYPVNVVALRHKHKKVDNFFNNQRESKGVRVIPLGRAVRNCLEALKRNEIICLLGDRDFTQGGVAIDFLGRQAMIPRGPAAFCLKNKAPLVVGITLRQPNNKFCIFFYPPIRFNPSGEYEKDLIGLTRMYLGFIEDAIRKYPDQWCVFRKFWQ